MKRTLKNADALIKIMTTVAPESTKTYKPTSHIQIINSFRDEIFKAGLKIINESYKTTHDGDFAFGSIMIDIAPVSDVAVSLNFSNSYNKLHGFSFVLGVVNKYQKTKEDLLLLNNLILPHPNNQYFSQTNKRENDMIKPDVIKNILQTCGIYFTECLNYIEKLKEKSMDDKDKLAWITHLFFENKINTMQLNILKNEVRHKEYASNTDTLWQFINQIAELLEETHPTKYIENHLEIYKEFDSYFYDLETRSIDSESEPEKDELRESLYEHDVEYTYDYKSRLAYEKQKEYEYYRNELKKEIDIKAIAQEDFPF